MNVRFGSKAVNRPKPGLSRLTPEPPDWLGEILVRINWKHLKKRRPALAGFVRCCV